MTPSEGRSGASFAWLAGAATPGPRSRYAVAIGALAAALLFRYLVRDSLGFKVPYLQFYPAIIVAAWFGGLGPSVATTVLAMMAAMYLFLPPAGFAVGDASDQLSLGVFVATGLVISWLNHRLHVTEAAHRTAAATAIARAQQLDAILNTTTDGIIVINAKGIIETFNRGAERLFGYPESEIIGRNVSLLMPSPQHDEHDQYLERYLATGEATIIGVGREVTGRRRDGTLFPVHLSIGEMRINGERKFTGMLHDLTKRADLEGALGANEVARWRAIVDSAVDAIIVIDAHGRVEAFNPAAERLFGCTVEEVLGKNVNMLMPSPYREEHDRPVAVSGDWTRQDHRHRAGRAGRAQGRQDVPAASVGGSVHHPRRAKIHRHSPRSRQPSRDGGKVAGAGGARQAWRNGGRGRARSQEPARRHSRSDPDIQQPHHRDDPNIHILKEIVSRIDSLDQMMKRFIALRASPPPDARDPMSYRS